MRWMSVGLISLLGACDSQANCDALGEPTLSLGQGEDTFRPLEAEDRLAWEYGPQGGAHVWLALRATGIWPGSFDLFGDDQGPDVQAEVTRNDGLVTEFPLRPVVFRNQGDTYEVTGLQMFGGGVTPTEDDDDNVGALWASVTDVCGVTVEATLPVGVR